MWVFVEYCVVPLQLTNCKLKQISYQAKRGRTKMMNIFYREHEHARLQGTATVNLFFILSFLILIVVFVWFVSQQASNTVFSYQISTSHQLLASQQYYSLVTNQHQSPAQPNEHSDSHSSFFLLLILEHYNLVLEIRLDSKCSHS